MSSTKTKLKSSHGLKLYVDLSSLAATCVRRPLLTKDRHSKYQNVLTSTVRCSNRLRHVKWEVSVQKLQFKALNQTGKHNSDSTCKDPDTSTMNT